MKRHFLSLCLGISCGFGTLFLAEKPICAQDLFGDDLILNGGSFDDVFIFFDTGPNNNTEHAIRAAVDRLELLTTNSNGVQASRFFIDRNAAEFEMTLCPDGLGLGNVVAEESLHILGGGTSSFDRAKILVEDIGNTSWREMMLFKNNGPVSIGMQNTAGTKWSMNAGQGGRYEIMEGSNPVFSINDDSVPSTEGFVGMGTLFPNRKLHIFSNSNDSDAGILIQNVDQIVAQRNLLQMTNSGPVRLGMTNSASGKTWTLVADNNSQFQIRQNGSNTANFAIRADGTFSFNNLGVAAMAVFPQGNVTIRGTLTQGSDRNAKENIIPVDPQRILAKVIDLPLSQWNYKVDENDTRHLGPMAQDFKKAFDLGENDTTISTLDTSGVALAAIQGLHQQLQEKDEEIKQLQSRLSRLESLIESGTHK